MTNYTGPLLIIASALMWCGGAICLTAAHGNRDEGFLLGSLAALVLLLIGLRTTKADRARRD
jgi:hypothetical protein